MATVTKKQFLDNIHNIISESVGPDISLDNSKKFGIKRYVVGLLEEGQKNPKLMTYLNRYNDILKQPNQKEFMLYEQFGQGLAQFGQGNEAVRGIISEINQNLKVNGSILEAYKLIEKIQDSHARNVVKECYDTFIECEDFESRDNLLNAIDALLQDGEPVAGQLILVITNGTIGSNIPAIEIGTSESKFDEIEKKLKKDRERRKIAELKDKVDSYTAEVFDAAKAEQEAAEREEAEQCCFDACVNNCGINLKDAIKTIAVSEAKSNARLMNSLNVYAGALQQGAYEERLYESFMQNMSQFNYLLPVEKELKRLTESIKANEGAIRLTKILEEMSSSNSYYLIPLIEEDVCRFIKNPTEVNKYQAQTALMTFAHDPFCSAILETIDSVFLGVSQADDILSLKDQLKVLREHATLENIYSPVQYIKEGECVFNANGHFFIKKGNQLAELTEGYLHMLSEKFIALCQLVNDPNVTIEDDHIVLLGHNKVANIYEGYADINGIRETADRLRNLNEMACKYDFDNNFFIMASCLLENFNNIAKVDFGKHVELNENSGIYVDLFKLDGNIFINAINENMNQETFYQNANPIQCRNIINNHMGLNIANLFEDLLPSQDKIMLKLNEARVGYEEAIEKYECTIEKLEKAKDECVNEDNAKKLDAALNSAKEKLDELKKEYKAWQEAVEKETTGKDIDTSEKKSSKKKSKKDDDTEEEPTSKPIDAKDVEDAKPKLQEPLTDKNDDDDNDDEPTISDDEFLDALKGDEEPDEEPAEKEPDDAEEPDDTKEEPTDSDESDDEPDVNLSDGTEDSDILPSADVENTGDETAVGDEDGFAETDVPEVTEPAEGDEDYTFTDDTLDDIFGDDDVDDVVDTPDVATTGVPEGYKIADISFDQNVKTNEVFKTGSVLIVIPVIDNSGNLHTHTETVNFYLDEINNTPILSETEGMPVALYNAIVATIKDDPMFSVAVQSQTACPDTIDEPDDDLFAPEDPEDPKYFSAEDINAASDEINNSDENEFFDIQDTEDGLTIAPKETEDVFDGIDDPDVNPNIDADGNEVVPLKDIQDNVETTEDDSDKPTEETSDDDKDDETDETDKDDEIMIPMYKEGDTEIELPAPDADDSKIKESKNKGTKSPQLNEQIVGIKSFFVNEGTAKPSKKEVAHINENNLDGIETKAEAPVNDEIEAENETEPYEEYDESHDLLTIGALKHIAEKIAETNDGLTVSDVFGEENLDEFHFKMFSLSNGTDDWAIYQLYDRIYCRPLSEVVSIIEDGQDEVPTYTASMLEVSFSDREEELDYVDATNFEDAKFVLNSVINKLGFENNLNESIKIKRQASEISAGGDFEKTKLAHDAKYGDKESNDFKEEIEKESKKAQVPNPMIAQPEQESAKQVLPNVHNELNEINGVNVKDIVYEPGDWVILKPNGKKAQVHTVSHDGDGKLTLLTVIASDGIVYDCEPSEIKPDPLYVDNIPGRVINSQNLIVPKFGDCDVNPKTRMTNGAVNDKPVDMADLNGKFTPVYIVVNGVRINMNPDLAVLEDIAKSKSKIRVMNERHEIYEYDANQNLEFADMPYAVLVDSEGRPTRSIKINPISYINAAEDDLVECTIGGKATKYPKKKIKIMS